MHLFLFCKRMCQCLEFLDWKPTEHYLGPVVYEELFDQIQNKLKTRICLMLIVRLGYLKAAPKAQFFHRNKAGYGSFVFERILSFFLL